MYLSFGGKGHFEEGVKCGKPKSSLTLRALGLSDDLPGQGEAVGALLGDWKLLYATSGQDRSAPPMCCCHLEMATCGGGQHSGFLRDSMVLLPPIP